MEEGYHMNALSEESRVIAGCDSIFLGVLGILPLGNWKVS